ncbi:MAG: phosphatidate cytidylyltransferase [Kouleothrix sp.]|jgi:phytol kinase|nr:phosphatidate cytidylyltransferase [Kouleothrix sp.]
MTSNDLIGLIASYAYAIGLIALAELLRRALRAPQELTRKLVHIGAGMWVFGVLALFDHWQWGVLPFASFIVGNYLFYRYRVFGSMDSDNGTPGTVYFALAITLLFALLWRPQGPLDHAPIAAAGAMALTWGDALAALVGRRYGWHRYRVGRTVRSWEGSAALVVAATISMFLVLTLLPGSALSPLATPIAPARALAVALVGASVAAGAEALSPHGTDNLSVPLVATGVLLLLV